MLHKICFVVFSLRGGGTERVVSELANALSKEVDSVVIQLSAMEPFYQLDPCVRLIRYPRSGSRLTRLFGLAWYLYRVLIRERPDVVVSFGERISPFVIAVAKLARVPVLASNRASPISSLSGQRSWLNPLAYRQADGVIVQTRRAVELLSERFRGCSWVVMENPVRFPDTVPDERARRNLCVCVGYLGQQKNQAAVIRAFARSAPEDWSLAIVGDGPDRQFLEALTAELELKGRVEFTGAVANVYDILLQARVFAFASRSEGFPNALAEAMACGCACIAYDCHTGPAELIKHNESGLLVGLDDEQDLAVGLQQLMDDAPLRGRLGSSARIRASELRVEVVSRRFIDSVAKTVRAG